MKTKYSVLILLLLSFLMLAPFSYAEVRGVEGLIEGVSGNSILVRGQYYDISGVPILNLSGEAASKSDLKTGNKVEIFLENGSITSIIIFPEDIVE